MHPIVYDVAVSLDGFICGPDGDVSQFAHEGDVVDDYMQRLSTYATAIMGRATYEFGYNFGLEPGQNPYPHMTSVVFSNKIQCPDDSEVVVRRNLDEKVLADLVAQATGPIYLCGGGNLAGALLQMNAIDRVVLKRAPIVLGRGVSLFGEVWHRQPFKRVHTKTYDNGYLLEEFAL